MPRDLAFTPSLEQQSGVPQRLAQGWRGQKLKHALPRHPLFSARKGHQLNLFVQPSPSAQNSGWGSAPARGRGLPLPHTPSKAKQRERGLWLRGRIERQRQRLFSDREREIPAVAAAVEAPPPPAADRCSPPTPGLSPPWPWASYQRINRASAAIPTYWLVLIQSVPPPGSFTHPQLPRRKLRRCQRPKHTHADPKP